MGDTMSGELTDHREGLQRLWDDVLRLPVRILLVGGAVILLYWLASVAKMPGISLLGSVEPKDRATQLLIGTLVFAVGVGLAGFLWWLSARFFGLIESKTLDNTSLSAIKDLPMGLPEGTVRAVLALIVAVVGLPILLFSGALALDPSIAGYVNGIITGVFGFYFGTRTAGVPSATVNNLADAQADARAKAAEADRLRQEAEAAKAAATVVTSQAQATVQSAQQRVAAAGDFGATLDSVQRHLSLARTIARTFGPALPAGLLPAGLDDAITKAESVVSAVQGVRAQDATPQQVQALTDVAATLVGKSSPLGALLTQAGPLLGALPIPGLGGAAGVATLVSVAVKLGSSQFQRWRARVLAAPVAQGLIEFGTLTPELVHAALRSAPTFGAALSTLPPAQVDAVLADAVLRENAPQVLLQAFGPQGSVGAVFPDLAAVESGLSELRQSLLTLYSADDVQDPAVRSATRELQAAQLPALADGATRTALGGLQAADVNRLIGAAAGLSANPNAPDGQRAAFDALVMLVDTARRENIDLGKAIAELKS